MSSPRAASSPSSAGRATPYFFALVGVALLLVFASLDVILRAPVERTMGVVQKIFYFHVPSAVAMYVGATTCFCG